MFKRFVELVMGKPQSQPSAPPPPQQKMQPLSKDAARPQHYTFAHRVMPSLLFENPDLFLNILSSQQGLEMLRLQWTRLEQYVAGAEPPTGLDYEIRRLDDGTYIFLITMPTPNKVTEAYFTCAVYRPAEGTTPALLRYFTLEYGMDFDPAQSKRNVLCEWTADKSHRNYGSREVNDLSGFFKVVCEQIDKGEVGWQASFVPKKTS